jgi:hypothetical protein
LSEISRLGVLGTSPFLKATPTVKGKVPEFGDVNWKEFTLGLCESGGELRLVVIWDALPADICANAETFKNRKTVTARKLIKMNLLNCFIL